MNKLYKEKLQKRLALYKRSMDRYPNICALIFFQLLHRNSSIFFNIQTNNKHGPNNERIVFIPVNRAIDSENFRQ